MDPATLALLIRTATELGVTVITLLRSTGHEAEAQEIEAILVRSDAAAERLIAKAKAELSALQAPVRTDPV